MDVHLSVMTYVYGDFDPDDDCGVMVFEDPKRAGYGVHDLLFMGY